MRTEDAMSNYRCWLHLVLVPSAVHMSMPHQSMEHERSSRVIDLLPVYHGKWIAQWRCCTVQLEFCFALLVRLHIPMGLASLFGDESDGADGKWGSKKRRFTAYFSTVVIYFHTWQFLLPFKEVVPKPKPACFSAMKFLMTLWKMKGGFVGPIPLAKWSQLSKPRLPLLS